MAKVTPEKKIKVGGIQLSIWPNKGDKGTFYSVTITKTYKDGNEWKQSKSFKPNDLEKVRIAIEEAQRYLLVKPDTIKPQTSNPDTKANEGDAPF